MHPVFHIAIRPPDGLGHLGVGPNVAHELAIEIVHRREDAAVDHLALDLRKPDLHLIQPGGVSRCEVELYLGIRLQEGFDGGRLMRREIVQDDVSFDSSLLASARLALLVRVLPPVVWACLLRCPLMHLRCQWDSPLVAGCQNHRELGSQYAAREETLPKAWPKRAIRPAARGNRSPGR